VLVLSPAQMELIRQFAEEVAVREGCRLYDLEFRDRILRVYIDREPGGVNIDDCANVSKGLNLRLDVEDVVPGGRYDLEVSSPGLERKLTQSWHFERAVGQSVQLRYRGVNGEPQSYEGKLTGVSGTQLNFENNKGPFTLEMNQVEKARVVLVDALGKKPPPGKKKR
jgi:ribosome maturation factor RimP